MTLGILCLAAGLFFLVSAVYSLFHFKTPLNRMHGAALGDSRGLLLTLLGVALLMGFTAAAWKLLLIAVFFMLTSPVATHLIAKTEVELHGNEYWEYEEEDRTHDNGD